MQFRCRVLGSELRPEPDASMWSTSRLASSLPAIHDGPFVVQVMCRFSDAGMTASPRGEAAGVRKAPRHEIAGGDGGWCRGRYGDLGG